MVDASDIIERQRMSEAWDTIERHVKQARELAHLEAGALQSHLHEAARRLYELQGELRELRAREGL